MTLVNLAKKYLHGCTKFLCWQGQKTEAIIGDILDYKRDEIGEKLNITPSEIPAMIFLNWAAPSLIPALVQESQIGMVTWALHDNMQSVAVVTAPVFTYNKGKLHLDETKMLEQLSKGNHNLDWQFSIQFKDRSDERDMRPLNYPGRFVFPTPLGDPKKNMWFHCALRKNFRTQEVPQLAPRGMKEIEDLSADALPVSCDARDGHIHGAAKYCQIGVPAWEAVLDGLLGGVDLSKTPAALLIDAYPRVGDLIEAFIRKRRGFATNLFMVAICEDATEEAWLVQALTDSIADNYDDGSMVPVSGAVDKELKEDALEPLPRVPEMHMLVIGGEHKNQLMLPAALCKKWQFHETFGKEFTAWLDNFTEKYTVIDPSVPEPTRDDKNKRGVDDQAPTPDNKKRARVSADNIVDPTSISEALLLDTKMVGKEAPMLQIRANHTIYILNKSAQEWASSMGFVASFGKGSFKLLKDLQDVPNGGIEFKVASSSDLVVLNGVVTELGAVIAEARVKKPDAQVSYHSLAIDDADPKKFTLKPSHRVAFIPKAEDDSPVNANNIGKKEAVEIWGSGSLVVLWAVRWAQKGLMPIKPVIHISGEMVIPPGRACKCTKP